MASAPVEQVSQQPRTLSGTLYETADLLFFLAFLNICLVGFTLLGGVVLGIAPALVASVSLVRARLRGDHLPMLRTFAATWRKEFVAANIGLGPLLAAMALLALNLLYFIPRNHLLVWPLWIGLGATVVLLAMTATMVAHYDLPRSHYLPMAARFMALHLPGAALIVVATGIVAIAVRLIPGLLPVIAPSAWVYLITALCISFYTHNDKSVGTISQERKPQS